MDYKTGALYIVDGQLAFHQERIIDADSEATGGNVGKEEFDEALNQTGLV